MVTINTYSELYEYYKAYNSGSFSFLIIQSRGGIGKSYHANHIIDESYTFTGHVSPYSLFKTVQNRPNQKLIFDDVDTLLENKTTVALLKQITDTKDKNVVRWNTTRGGKDNSEKFISKNNTLLLANKTNWNTADLQALKTRAIFIEFKPSNEEVYNQLKQFLGDTEILQFFQSLDIQPETLNFRAGIKAKEIKKAGLDWKKYIKTTLNEAKPNYTEIARECKEKTSTSKEAVELYKERTGRSMKSFYNDL